MEKLKKEGLMMLFSACAKLDFGLAWVSWLNDLLILQLEYEEMKDH